MKIREKCVRSEKKGRKKKKEIKRYKNCGENVEIVLINHG